MNITEMVCKSAAYDRATRREEALKNEVERLKAELEFTTAKLELAHSRLALISVRNTPPEET